MAKIREILVDKDDIREMLSSDLHNLEIDASHVYCFSDILGGDDPTILRWDRHMQLSDPGELQSPGVCNVDYDGIMRHMLTPYVGGLERSSIGLFFGDLLEEKRQGKWVLEAKLFDKAKNTVVIIHWPAAEPINYFDDGLSGLEKDLGLQLRQRTSPGGKDESYGEDVLVLQSNLLDDNLWERMRIHDSFRTAMLEDRWTDFEVSRGYYRAKMEKLQGAIAALQLRLEFQEDFAWVKTGKGDLAESFAKKSGSDAFGRCWYDSKGLMKLRTTIRLLGPAVSAYELLGRLSESL